MTFNIPITQTMREALQDPSRRFLKVSIDFNDTTVILNPTKLSANISEEYQSWNVKLKNYGEYSEGLFAGLPVTVSFSHNNSEWITLMTGYVTTEGMVREEGFTTDDVVSFDLVDRTRGKGTRRKPSKIVFAGLKISDPSDTSNSILHRLGALMGITSFDAGLITDVKDIVSLGEQAVWTELKLLRDAFKAEMYFDYLGRLRFHSPLETGWAEPVSEWTFVASPSFPLDPSSSRVIGKIRRTFSEIGCNHAISNLSLYDHRSSRVIYRDTTNWNADLSQCSIMIQPGQTWPEKGVASLSYKDPETNEEYPYAINVQDPTLGQNKGYDIVFSSGNLALISFNGSSSQTAQQPNASQIILKNVGSSVCEIIKFEITGEPFAQVAESKVEEIDASVVDEVDYVDLEVDGRYATSVEQIDKVLARHVEEGKTRKRHFSFSTMFLPHIQRGMRCNLIDTDGSPITCKLATYSHKAGMRTLDTMRTQVELDEIISYEPTYNPIVDNMTPQPSIPMRGKPGDKVIIQFALGDGSGPFSGGWALGQDNWVIGQDDWMIGVAPWVYEPPIPGEGEYVYQRIGYYNPAEASWPSVWSVTRSTGLPGVPGAPAKVVTISSSSMTLPTTSRGVPKIDSITFTAMLQNISITQASDIVWLCSDPGVILSPVPGSLYSVTLNTDQVTTSQFTVMAEVDGEFGLVGVNVVADGMPAPARLGVRTEVPDASPFGPLVQGDYFLAGTTFVDDGKTYDVGEVYEYDGSVWLVTNDTSKILAMNADFVQLTESTPTTIASKVIARRVYAQEAVIDEIMSNYLEVKRAVYSGYSKEGEPPADGSGFWLGANGKLKAKYAELIGTLKTGDGASDSARVAIRDQSGIIAGPNFTGIGFNNLSVIKEGTVAGKIKIRITTRRYISHYEIGDTGPGGGTIFYRNGNYYLEVAPDSTRFKNKVWGGYGTAIGGTSTAIGTGKANTQAIIAAFGSAEPYEGYTDYAAKVCSELSFGGYSDWFLPSKDETTQLYNNLISKGLAGPWYGGAYNDLRTSSEINPNSDWTLYKNGNWFYWPELGKPWRSSIFFRAVREFTLPDETFQYCYSTDGGVSYTNWSSDMPLGNFAIPGFDITIAFGSLYGHFVGDLWEFEQGAMYGLSIRDSAGNEYVKASNGSFVLKKANGLPFFTAYDGAVDIGGPLGASSINTGDGNFKVGQNLRASDNVAFNTLALKGKITALVTQKDYPVINGYWTIDPFEIGETRFVTLGPLGTSNTANTDGVKLPAGGTYIAFGRYDITHYDSYNSTHGPGAMNASQPDTHVVLSGGAWLAWDNGGNYDLGNGMFIVRRIS